MGACVQAEERSDDEGKVGSPKMKIPERLPKVRSEPKHPESYCLHFTTALWRALVVRTRKSPGRPSALVPSCSEHR